MTVLKILISGGVTGKQNLLLSTVLSQGYNSQLAFVV
jgi:hypothetical protein